MRERDPGRLLITLEDFRSVVEIPDTYRFADIKRPVIEMAVNELNSKADLVISWKPMMHGRAVNSLDFQIIQHPQSRLDLGDAA